MLSMKKDDRRAGQSSQNHNVIRVDLPLFYRDTTLTAREAEVIRLIPRGAERKIAMKDLASLAGMDTRAVQDIISSAKKKGVPIISSRKAKDHGYYIAETEAERRNGLVNLKHQANEILAGIDGITSADLDNWEKITGYSEVVNQ